MQQGDGVEAVPTFGAGPLAEIGVLGVNAKPISLGLGVNWQQFTLLVLVNAFVGAMLGLERTVVPLIAEEEFGIVSKSAVLTFIVSFGIVKALSNVVAGRLADQMGRKWILVVGWLFGLPVPLLIIFAPSWGWIIFANVLLGVNQGLCWSTTVIMKIDLVGPKRRGLAMGLNESAGYLAVAVSALATGFLAASYALRPHPFYPGIAFAVLGLFFSIFFVRETRDYARLEGATAPSPPVSSSSSQDRDPGNVSFAQVLAITSWKNRALFAASQAGMVNNLNDAMVWGLVPILLVGSDMSLKQVAIIAATYPGIWGLGQLFTGALSDRLGRKWMIVGGMWVQALGIMTFVIAQEFWLSIAAAAVLGVGTALVYPTLLAAVSDVAHPSWRASAVGVYRLWRDGGFAIGALMAGLLADALGISTSISVIGGLTFLSGVVAAGAMYETRWTPQRSEP